MAKQVIKFVSDDGKEFDTLAEAEMRDRVHGLSLALSSFEPHFPEDGYDTDAAAQWLINTFDMTRKQAE